MRLKNPLLALTVCCLLAGCGATTIRRAKDFQPTELKGAHTVVLPFEARVFEGETSQNKRLFDFEYNIETMLSDAIMPSLIAKGFRARLLTRRDVYEKNLHEIIGRLDERIFAVDDKQYKNFEVNKDVAFVMDEHVKEHLEELKKAVPADVYLSVRYTRTIKSSGSQAISFGLALLGLPSGGPADLGDLRLALIEAKTGRVVWMNKIKKVFSTFFSSDNKKEELNNIREMLKKLVEELDLSKELPAQTS